MPRMGLKVFAVCAAIAAGVPASSSGPALAGSIYQVNVESLDLTSQQRAQVRKIMAESARKANAVFKKYGIDPNARPVFQKLQQASNELQAVQQQERRSMQKVLNQEQYKQYSKLVTETQARVRAAAQ